MRHPFFCTVICQRQHRPARFRHQLFCALRNGREGIARDQQGFGEVGFRGVNIAPGQLILVRVGDGMDDKVQPAPKLVHLFKHGIKRRGVGHVAVAQNMPANFGGQRLNALLELVTLIGEGKLGTLQVAGFGNAPGNRHLVGNTHDKPTLASHDVATLWFVSHALHSALMYQL